VSCVFADIEEQPCEGRNISESGALLRVGSPPLPDIGTLVELRLESKETGPLPVLDAEVVRVDVDRGLFAVRFINLDPARRAILRRIVEEPPPSSGEHDPTVGAYSVQGGRARIPTKVFEEDQLSNLVETSKAPTGEERAVSSRSRSSGAGYPNIADAVRSLSAEHATVGDAQAVLAGRLADGSKVPVVKLGIDAIPWEQVNPLVAVVLAKVNGRRTYEQIIDATVEVSREQAEALLVELLDHRIIGDR
jgi:hypothetical protein